MQSSSRPPASQIAKQPGRTFIVRRPIPLHARTKAYLPSYVEWLTCLEMERDVRNLRREPTPGVPKRYTSRADGFRPPPFLGVSG